jgi:hypothetical protein
VRGRKRRALAMFWHLLARVTGQNSLALSFAWGISLDRLTLRIGVRQIIVSKASMGSNWFVDWVVSGGHIFASAAPASLLMGRRNTV